MLTRLPFELLDVVIGHLDVDAFLALLGIDELALGDKTLLVTSDEDSESEYQSVVRQYVSVPVIPKTGLKSFLQHRESLLNQYEYFIVHYNGSSCDVVTRDMIHPKRAFIVADLNKYHSMIYKGTGLDLMVFQRQLANLSSDFSVKFNSKDLMFEVASFPDPGRITLNALRVYFADCKTSKREMKFLTTDDIRILAFLGDSDDLKSCLEWNKVSKVIETFRSDTTGSKPDNIPFQSFSCITTLHLDHVTNLDSLDFPFLRTLELKFKVHCAQAVSKSTNRLRNLNFPQLKSLEIEALSNSFPLIENLTFGDHHLDRVDLCLANTLQLPQTTDLSFLLYTERLFIKGGTDFIFAYDSYPNLVELTWAPQSLSKVHLDKTFPKLRKYSVRIEYEGISMPFFDAPICEEISLDVNSNCKLTYECDYDCLPSLIKGTSKLVQPYTNGGLKNYHADYTSAFREFFDKKPWELNIIGVTPAKLLGRGLGSTKSIEIGDLYLDELLYTLDLILEAPKLEVLKIRNIREFMVVSALKKIKIKRLESIKEVVLPPNESFTISEALREQKYLEFEKADDHPAMWHMTTTL